MLPRRAGFKPLYDTDFYQTNWTLTHICNYSCSYCVNKHIRAAGASLPRDDMLRALDALREADKDAYFFALAGGEVTLYKHLGEMLDRIARDFSGKRHAVRLISNGSAPAEKMADLFGRLPGGDIMCVITLHFEEGDASAVADKLSSFGGEADKRFLVKVLIEPGKTREGGEAVGILRAAGFRNYRVLHVLDFVTGVMDPRYTPEELETIAALREECGKEDHFIFFHEYDLPEGGRHEERFTYTQGIQRGLLRYPGMFCAAGSNSVKINPDASFARSGFCGAMPYSLRDKNPFDDPAFTAPMRCPEKHCTCVAYLKLPKWREDADAPVRLRRRGA
jgi:hypothetical protein